MAEIAEPCPSIAAEQTALPTAERNTQAMTSEVHTPAANRVEADDGNNTGKRPNPAASRGRLAPIVHWRFSFRGPNEFRTDSERTPNGHRTDSERTPNGPRMDPAWTPYAPRTDLERTPNRSRADPERSPNRPQTDPARTPNGPRTDPGRSQSTPRLH